MPRRRNFKCNCDGCCPKATIYYTDDECKVVWSATSCCGNDYILNQQYTLKAYNSSNVLLADYGDVGHSGEIIGIRGATYMLTVSGPDCQYNRTYSTTIPDTACPECTPICAPAYKSATMSVTGFTNADTGYYIQSQVVPGPMTVFRKSRETASFLALNHTKSFPLYIDRFDSSYTGTACFGNTMDEDEYLIGSVTTTRYIEYLYGVTFDPPATAVANWTVYGALEGKSLNPFTSEVRRNPYYRLKFVLDSYTEITFHVGGTYTYRAPGVPSGAVATGYSLYTEHVPSLYLGATATEKPHAGWCNPGRSTGTPPMGVSTSLWNISGFFQWSGLL